MKAYTKKLVLLTSAVLVCMVISDAFARRYDTMMIGYDRWIDIGHDKELHDDQELQGDPQKDCRKLQMLEKKYHQIAASIKSSYYSGEPNSVSYLNYQDYEPDLPNDNDPNMPYYPWPPDPNDVIDVTADPNESTEEETDPNDTENNMPIIFDYGIAKKASFENIPALSFSWKLHALKE